MSLDDLLQRIAPVDPAVGAATQRILDEKTKPRGSLGALEALACRIAESQGAAPSVPLRHAAVVFAADHGVAASGVSAYPQTVTAQMIENFVRGGAAVSVLCRQVRAQLLVVDVGSLAERVPSPAIDRRVGRGTRSWLEGPAMTEAECSRALQVGIDTVERLADEGVTAIALGEMGIGNSTTAALLVAGLTGAPVDRVVGLGTGISEAMHSHKRAVVADGLARHGDMATEPLAFLRSAGGFEIAALVGALLAGAARRRVLVLDGFIVGAAALVAWRICPAVRGYLVASHRSAEAGHALVLDALGLEPLLSLALRLGEASGAVLALPLLDAAVAVLTEMATFAEAGVAEAGDG